MVATPYGPGLGVTMQKLHFMLESPSYRLSPEQMQTIASAWRFWRREPERSRRVIRLAVANWLAYQELPPGRRPAPDPRVISAFKFYTFGPRGAGRGPRPVARGTGPLARHDHRRHGAAPPWDLRKIRIQERANHRALVVMLASQLYRRERGTDPPSEEALVGPYLESLPDDGLGDAGHETPSVAGETKGAAGPTGRE